MGYLFDPANWEWIFAGRNFMFLLERFLNNIIIALIVMAFSLILGLVIVLLRISKNKFISTSDGNLDRHLAQPAGSADHPLLRPGPASGGQRVLG